MITHLQSFLLYRFGSIVYLDIVYYLLDMRVPNRESPFLLLIRKINQQESLSLLFILVKMAVFGNYNQVSKLASAFVSIIFASLFVSTNKIRHFISESLNQYYVSSLQTGTHCTIPPHPPPESNLRITGWDGISPIPIGEVFGLM